MSNAEQREYWNGEAGANWVAQAEELDAMLQPIGESTLVHARLQVGERVLDIGCGSGALTLAAQSRVAPSGQATGLDISQPLIDNATRRAVSINSRARFTLADASTWHTDTKFDAVISRFGVMFFENPTDAFGNILRLVQPGGRLTFACWRDPKENDMGSGLMHAVAHLFAAPAVKPDPKAPGPFAFADQGYVTQILRNAGWDKIRFDKWDGVLPLTKTTARANAQSFLKIGAVSRLMREQSVSVDRVLDALTALMEQRQQEDGTFALAAAVWIVSATKSSAS